jgi:hypothetical protein
LAFTVHAGHAGGDVVVERLVYGYRIGIAVKRVLDALGLRLSAGDAIMIVVRRQKD